MFVIYVWIQSNIHCNFYTFLVALLEYKLLIIEQELLRRLKNCVRLYLYLACPYKQENLSGDTKWIAELLYHYKIIYFIIKNLWSLLMKLVRYDLNGFKLVSSTLLRPLSIYKKYKKSLFLLDIFLISYNFTKFNNWNKSINYKHSFLRTSPRLEWYVTIIILDNSAQFITVFEAHSQSSCFSLQD